MKRICLFLALPMFFSIATLAQVPKTLNFQGVLINPSSGDPVADASYSFTFQIWDAVSAGTSLWTESQSLTTADGLYNAVLGTVTPLNIAFDQPYWLEVTVGAETLSPRVEITAPAYMLDDDIEDLADGSLSGSKVGSGISGANITDGTISTAKISGTIAIADGGTNATTAATARTNLGLTIGSSVQAYDPDLADLADGSLTGSKVGSGVSGANITDGTISTSKISGTIAIADGGTNATIASTARANLGLAIGTNVQAYDADLDDLADGSLSGSKVGTGINGSNISTGTILNSRLNANIERTTFKATDYMAAYGGVHVGSLTDPGTDNLVVDGTSTLTGDTGIGDVPDSESRLYVYNTLRKYGLFVNSRFTNPAAVNDLYGARYFVDNDGTGLAYGLSIDMVGSGSGTNTGLFISNASNGSGLEYGIRTLGEDLNYFHGDVGIGISVPNVALDVSGSIEYTGTITDVSDRRLKKNIHNLTGSLEKVLVLRGVSFEMKDPELSEREEFGVIAQEIEKVYPELVFTDPEGYKSVNYVGLIAPLIEALKEQQKILEQQSLTIESLQTDKTLKHQQLNELSDRLQKIEQLLNLTASEK